MFQKENELKVAVHMNGISVFQHSSLSTLKSFIILLRAFAMAPNEFIIRAAKDASGNFTGLMNCNPALIKFGDTAGKNNMIHQHHVSEQEDCD
jgi:hypothetical protein